MGEEAVQPDFDNPWAALRWAHRQEDRPILTESQWLIGGDDSPPTGPSRLRPSERHVEAVYILAAARRRTKETQFHVIRAGMMCDLPEKREHAARVAIRLKQRIPYLAPMPMFWLLDHTLEWGGGEKVTRHPDGRPWTDRDWAAHLRTAWEASGRRGASPGSLSFRLNGNPDRGWAGLNGVLDDWLEGAVRAAARGLREAGFI